jgi:hypothetical protein
VEFVETPAEELRADASTDLVPNLDRRHDMIHPQLAAKAISSTLTPDGTWLIKEIKSGDAWAENQRNPVLAMMYATSVLTYTSSALSEPDGAGPGTLGLPPGRPETLFRDAGVCGSFEIHDIEDPANLYYEVRLG